MIEFDGVTKSFAGKEVLRGLTFVARDGAVTGFVGPNGAGKSTAFKILLGLLTADGGTALVDGKRYSLDPAMARHVGAAVNAQWIPARMSGRGYLEYICDLKGSTDVDIDDALVGVGIADAADRTVKGYSMGMRQRLSIAGALMGSPQHLVLDEPVNGLDVEAVRWLRGTLRGAADQGRCVLMSSHLLSELELAADDVVMLSQGRVGREGRMTDMRRVVTEDVLVASVDNDELARLLAAHGAIVESEGVALRVKGRSVNWVARVAGAGEVVLHSVSRPERSLEDVYLDQIGGEEEGLPS